MKHLITTLVCSGVLVAACANSPEPEGDARRAVTTTTTTPGGSPSAAPDADIEITYERNGKDVFTIVQDGTDRVVYRDARSWSFSGPDRTVTCTGRGRDAACTEFAAGGPGSVTTLLSPLYAGLRGLEEQPEEQATIAGRDAECITVDRKQLPILATMTGATPDAKLTARVCLDVETGHLLKIEIKGKNVNERIVATKVSTPDGADFEPPSPPSTLPDPSTLTVPTMPPVPPPPPAAGG
jgi:hypothetical protein